MRCSMVEVVAKEKGEYFSMYNFGTCITPDSDELVRTGTVAMRMLRLLVATAAFRACYKHLHAKEASAMRAAVWRIPTVSQALTSSRRASGALLRSLRRVALMGGLWTRRPSQGPFFQWWISVVTVSILR